ncbi:MAG TPA: ATP-binding protein [Jiangellales bacterium]|nr:ATP-binding protein [Jiangellales bacterium]
MAEVELRIDPLTSHVRTARQVAVALARRAGVAPDVLDEVRLAVGEACGLAVALQRREGDREPVVLSFDDSDGLAIEVRGSAGLASAEGDDAVRVLAEAAVDDASDDEALPAGASLAVLAELVPGLAVSTGPSGPRLGLRWPQG